MHNEATLHVAWANFVRLHESSQAIGVTDPIEPIDNSTQTLKKVNWILGIERLQEARVLEELQGTSWLRVPSVSPSACYVIYSSFVLNPQWSRHGNRTCADRALCKRQGLTPKTYVCPLYGDGGRCTSAACCNRGMRERLYKAATSVTCNNPSVGAIHRQLNKRGKTDKVVQIATARRLPLITAEKELSSNSHETWGCLNGR